MDFAFEKLFTSSKTCGCSSKSLFCRMLTSAMTYEFSNSNNISSLINEIWALDWVICIFLKPSRQIKWDWWVCLNSMHIYFSRSTKPRVLEIRCMALFSLTSQATSTAIFDHFSAQLLEMIPFNKPNQRKSNLLRILLQ